MNLSKSSLPLPSPPLPSPPLPSKVILMSATLDSELFARYFAVRISGRLELAPIVQVEGRSYRVTEFYLDDIKHIGEVRQEANMAT